MIHTEFGKNIFFVIALVLLAINLLTIMFAIRKTGKQDLALLRTLKKDYPWTDRLAWIMIICLVIYIFL